METIVKIKITTPDEFDITNEDETITKNDTYYAKEWHDRIVEYFTSIDISMVEEFFDEYYGRDGDLPEYKVEVVK